MDRLAWQATVHEVTESDTTEQLTQTSPPSDMSNKYLHMLGPQINLTLPPLIHTYTVTACSPCRPTPFLLKPLKWTTASLVY